MAKAEKLAEIYEMECHSQAEDTSSSEDLLMGKTHYNGKYRISWGRKRDDYKIRE